MKTKLSLLIAFILTLALLTSSCEFLLPSTGDYPSSNNPNISGNATTENTTDAVVDECMHTFGAWVITLEPTYSAEGIEQRNCSKCGNSEVRKIAPLANPYNTDSDKYKDYDGFLVTELMYYTNDITVLSIYEKTTYSLILVVRNESDSLIEYLQIPYTFYGDNDSVRGTGTAGASYVRPHESVTVTVTIDNNTAKVRLGDATVNYSTNAYTAPETVVDNGVEYNKLPYTTNGITVTSFEISKADYSATVFLRNDTGKAIKSANLTVYVYDKDGIRMSYGYISVSSVAPGATVSDDFGINVSGSAYMFGEATYFVDENYVDTSEETEVNSFGIKTNKLPYTLSGITIVEMVAKSDYYATFVIRNDSNKVLSKTSSIFSEMFDSDDIKFDTKISTPQNLNPGESCYVDVRINDRVNGIIFTQIIFREGEEFESGETAKIDGIYTNVLPLTSNGLQITSIEFGNDSHATVTIKNVSSTAFTNYSYFPCKVYDSKNIVTNSGNLYITHLDPGQSCKLSIYLGDDPATLKFGNAVVKEGELFPNTDMTVINGISINNLPYTSNGVTAISYEFTSSTCISVVFRNDTDGQLGNNASITYKCLDANGVVVKEGEISLNRTFPNETESRNLIITNDTVTVLLGTCSPT